MYISCQMSDHESPCKSYCRCADTPEARYFSARDVSHVHCFCAVCQGKAVYPMTAWRHGKRAKRAKLILKDEISGDIEPQLEKVSAAAVAEGTWSSPSEYLTHCGQQNPSPNFMENDWPDLNYDDNLDEEINGEVGDNDDEELEELDQNDADGCEEGQNGRDEHVDVAQFIAEAVLKLVEMKGDSGFSIATLEKLLNWGKELHCHDDENLKQNWPSSWQEVQLLLEQIGYKHAKLYWICLDKTHPCIFGLMESKDEICPHCRKKGKIPYYYLSVIDKVKRFCSSPAMCKKMTMHWKENDHWLPEGRKEGWGCPLKREMWDGSRFAELAYFWNPDVEWILPAQCPSEGCKAVISIDTLFEADILHDVGVQERRNVVCPGCGNAFIHTVQLTHGDPRNLAYIGHWDGWQPFSTTSRGCGAIEVSIATMSKEERCQASEVYVVGFVPSYLLPNKSPISLDPFLEPLIQEIEMGFINGIQVNYAIPICGKPAGPATLRHLILCWAGDHMGQCEVGKMIKCGKNACRRCSVHSVYIPEACHYYYPEFRRQARFPAQPKDILQCQQQLMEIEDEERVTVKKEMAKQTGYTGLSILHRLYPLYGFTYDKDLVFDEMHTIQLNVVKKALSNLLQGCQDGGNPPEQDIDWQTVDSRLDAIPWTTELKSSRIPTGITSRVGYWKAEEYSKFAFPASEVVFAGILTNSKADEWSCVARIEEFIQRHARGGWTEADATTFHEMALRYGVLVEEGGGPQQCVITLHNLLHFKEDIKRHSGLDNYACWVQERAVKRYIRQSNNHKNIECTFASTELRREVLKFHGKDETEDVDQQNHVDPQQLWAKSVSRARKLHSTNRDVRCHSQKGILVGGCKGYTLPDHVKQSIAACYDTGENNIEPTGVSCRSIWKANHAYNGLLYRKKEHAIVITPTDGEVVVQLQNLFTVCINGHYEPFFEANQFVYAEGDRMNVQPSDQQIVGQTENISRKIMLCPTNDAFMVIDFMRRLFPVTVGSVVVPCYPLPNDMVLLRGDREIDIWRARVVSSNLRQKSITGRFFEKDGEFWIPEHNTRNETIWFSSILGLADGQWVEEFTKWQEL